MTSARALAHERPAPDVWLSAHEQYDSIITRLRAPQAQHMTHSALEQLLETEGRELLRRLLQAHLDERSPGAVSEPVVGTTGAAHTQQRPQPRMVETIFGAVRLTRQGYGGRGRESLHPLDAELNLPPERYSHTVRQRVARSAASHYFD